MVIVLNSKNYPTRNRDVWWFNLFSPDKLIAQREKIQLNLRDENNSESFPSAFLDLNEEKDCERIKNASPQIYDGVKIVKVHVTREHRSNQYQIYFGKKENGVFPLNIQENETRALKGISGIKSEKLNTNTYNYSQKSYNNALSVIPANIVNEVYDSLAFVFITGEPKKINKALNSKFTRNRGWVSNSEETFVEPFRPESKRGRFQVDHFRDGVGLEQEFRTSRDLLFDLLKLQLGHNWKRLSSGIIITFDENIKGKGDYLQRNKPYLQELDRLINRFGSAINFTIPLLVIGLKERRA